jgi:hypothetical protein
VKVVIHKEPARRGSGPCSVVRWSSTAGQLTLFTGFATGKVSSYSLVDGSMRKASVVSVGVAVRRFQIKEYVVFDQLFIVCLIRYNSMGPPFHLFSSICRSNALFIPRIFSWWGAQTEDFD